MKINTNEVITICGLRGAGKSYLMKHIIKQTSSFFLYDVNWEHEYKDVITTSDIRHAKQLLERGTKKIIYRPQFVNLEEFDYICQMVYVRGNLMLFVEEANRVIPNMQIGKFTSNLVDRGRHRNVGMCNITRRIALLDKLPVSQSHHLFVFKTILPNDIAYLKDFIGEMAEKASTLDNYHFIHHSDQGTIIHEPI